MTTIHRIGTGVVLALALAASAAPASARVFDLNANGSYVPAAGVRAHTFNPNARGLTIVPGQIPSASPAVRPNPDEPTPPSSDTGAGRHVRVAGVPRCPVRGPCISPDSKLTQGLSEEQAAALGYRGGPASATASPADGASTSGHAPRPKAASSGETFGWGDAGIGAVGMLLLVGAGVAVAATTRRQRHRAAAS